MLFLQLSVESLWSLIVLLDGQHFISESGSETETSSSIDSPNNATSPPLPTPRSLAQLGVTQERSSRLCGLDIHSCLQFLLELYEAMLSPSANPRTPLILLNETIRSVSLCYLILQKKIFYNSFVFLNFLSVS